MKHCIGSIYDGKGESGRRRCKRNVAIDDLCFEHFEATADMKARERNEEIVQWHVQRATLRKRCGGCGLTPSEVARIPPDERLGCCAPVVKQEAKE